jgi:hypothetical protein
MYIQNGSLRKLSMEDLAEYVLNLAPRGLNQEVQSGETRCARLKGGFESGSIVVIRSKKDFRSVKQLAADSGAEIDWYAAELSPFGKNCIQ